MKSRWSDAAAAGLSELDLLVYASRLIGAETSLVVWGGGNTSVKRMERDYRGREVRILRVKGSGSDLKSIQRKDFPGVRMDDLLALLERDEMADQEMVDYFAHALLEPASPRPSIETPLHGFLPVDAVIHTHADAIVSLTNNDRCPEVLRQVYGGEVVALAYLRPGFPIAKQVADAFRCAPPGACDPAREAWDHLLGSHPQGGVPRHHRADQPRRGGHRASGPRAGALRRGRRSPPSRPPTAVAWPSPSRPRCAVSSAATGVSS